MNAIKKFQEERNFGLIVGGVFFVLGTWWIYREKYIPFSIILSILGGILIICGALLPKILVIPNRLWMKLAEVLAFISTHIILAIVFFGVVFPIGFIKRLFGYDPLNRRAKKSESYWQDYPERQQNIKHYEKMY
jgi:glucan phosphoethanolaminetransferase (alkaline phosphatase superfamily)